MADRKKILIISDAIAAQTGFARIAHDLAVRIHDNMSDVCEIATFGYGSPASTKIPIPQIAIEGMEDWTLPSLPQVCDDFFGKERGIIWYIWDVSRTGWLSQPVALGNELLKKFQGLQQWAMKANIDKWLYTPVDGSGPNERLTFPLMLALAGFDRLIAYGPFGEDVIRKTIGDEEANKRHLTNLPHAVDFNTFWEIDRDSCRRLFFEKTGASPLIPVQDKDKPISITPIADDETLIGIVATNQARKDWQLGIATVAEIAKKHKIRLWLHTDDLERAWSIAALLVDYGLIHHTVVTLGYLSDDIMALAYSACDLCLGIGPEGFGLPNAEALACGTPVVTGSYAGSGDFVPKNMLVDPIAFRFEGVYATKRPVYSPIDWAAKAESWIGYRTSLDDKYDWANNWPVWEKYLREALCTK